MPQHTPDLSWPGWTVSSPPYSRFLLGFSTSQPHSIFLIQTPAVTRWQDGQSFDKESPQETMRTWPTCKWMSQKLHQKNIKLNANLPILLLLSFIVVGFLGFCFLGFFFFRLNPWLLSIYHQELSTLWPENESVKLIYSFHTRLFNKKKWLNVCIFNYIFF